MCYAENILVINNAKIIAFSICTGKHYQRCKYQLSLQRFIAEYVLPGYVKNLTKRKYV